MTDTALLVIDVQLGVFMRKQIDGMTIYREEALLENIAALIKKARDAGRPVVYVAHMYEDLPVMAKGEPLWQVHPALAPQADEILVEKWHADAFFDSSLEDVLRSRHVSELVITGIATDYCVDTTCRRALSLRYRNTLVADGHSTFDSPTLRAEQIIEHHNFVLGSQFAQVRCAREIAF